MFRFKLFGGFLFFFYSYHSPILGPEEWGGFVRQSGTGRRVFWERVSSISRHPGRPPRKGHSRNKGEKPAFLLAGPPERGPNWCSGYLPFAGRPFLSLPGRHRADMILCTLRSLAFPERVSNCGGGGTRSTLTLAVHGPALDPVGALLWLPLEGDGSWHY